MNRKMFLSIPIVLLGALILSVLGLVAFAIVIIPVMIKPSIVANFKPADKFSEFFTKRMVQAAMKGSKSRT